MKPPISLALPNSSSGVRSAFPRRRFAAAAIGVSFSAAVIYLSAVAAIFNLGFRIQEAEARLEKEKEAVTMLEISLREKDAVLARDPGAFLDNMESISHMRYITSDEVAISLLRQNP
jgi:hypothetical protein